jgi:hypothetical protein
VSLEEWPQGDGAREQDGLTSDPEGKRDKEAALDAACRLLEGPYVRVPRTTWLCVLATVRELERVIQRVVYVDEAGGRQSDDGRGTE